jgi:hypothetical protein
VDVCVCVCEWMSVCVCEALKDFVVATDSKSSMERAGICV